MVSSVWERRIDRRRFLQYGAAAALPLYYGNSYAVARRSVYDTLAYTPGGFATGITSVTNKQLFITRQRSGTQIVKTAS